MYGLWYLVIGFVILMVIGIVLICLSIKFSDWNDVDTWYGFLGIIFIVIGGIGFLVSLFSGIFTPLNAKRKYETFINQQEYVYEAIENGEDYENIATTQIIIELNTWLAEAKASKSIYGCFSPYYYLDLDSLEPIVAHQD